MGIFQKLFKKEPPTIVVKQEIDYDKLADAIVKAQINFKVYEKNEAEKQEDIDRKNWREIIGYEEIEENWTWRKKKWQAFKNDCATFKAILFFKSGNAKLPRLSFELMRLGTSMVYGFCEFALFLIAAYFVIAPFVIHGATLVDYISMLMALPAVLFSRLIRIAKLEVINLENKDILNTLFSANMTFVGIVLAIIAIVIEVI